jgi:hypothetical protein
VLNAVSSSFALTASSADNLLVRNTLTAQTLVVQTITSSVDFVTGSTRFGSVIDNTHQFTGSLLLNGSSSIQAVPNGVGEYYYLTAKGGYNNGFSIYEYNGNQYINASSSMFLRYNNLGGTTGVFAIVSGSSEVLRITAAGNVNIGRTDDFYKFSVSSGFPKTETNAKGLMFIGSNEANASNPFGLVVTVTGASTLSSRMITVGTTDFGLANGGILNIQGVYFTGSNVGIGTLSPTVPLTIAVPAVGSAIGASNAQTAFDYSRLRIKHYTDSNLGLSIGYAGANRTYIQACYNEGTAAPLLLNAFGGIVGIGTIPDTAQLDVKQSATGTSTVNTAFRDSSTNGNALQIWNGNGEARLRAIYYGTPSDQNITFYTVTSGGSEAERMRITSGGVLRFSSVPFNNYQLDTSTPISVANGGTIPFETFSGLIIINNHSNGNIGMWMVGAGYTVLVSQVYGAAVGTMAYSGAINGYVWTSNSGVTSNYGVFAVITRSNA